MPRKAETIVIAALILAISALIVTVVLMSWVPPVSRDALTHHLAVPKLYIQHGGMVELPHIPFSYYPMNLDLLYLLPLLWGNDILPKLIHFVFGLLTAGIIFSYVKKRLGKVLALFGALFFLSLPVIIKLSTTVYVDLGLVFFTTAALLALFRWGRDRRQFKYFVLSGVCCGLALGTKYNGLVALFILTMLVAVIYLRYAPGKEARQITAAALSAAYLAIALAVFAPWMVRNAIWTGNPVYPLYQNIFSTDSTNPDDEIPTELQTELKRRTQDWNHLAIRRIIYGESWGQIALLPLRIFFQGQDDTPQFFDGRLNPFLLILTLLAFVPHPRFQSAYRFEKNALLAFVVLFLLFSFFKTSIRIRYIAPIIPPLVILSCFGVSNLFSIFMARQNAWAVRTGKTVVLVTALLLFWMNTLYVIEQFHKIDPLNFISGRMGRDAYIAKHRPEYPVMQYANLNLAESDRILGLFVGNRRYYCDRLLIFGEKYLSRTVISASGAEDVKHSLQASGYTHVIVHLKLLKEWAGSLNEKERRIAADFFNHDMEILKQNQEYALLGFKDSPR